MIVVTGAAGFIGSCMVAKLNKEAIERLILVDDFSNPDKNKNLIDKKFSLQIDRTLFLDWLQNNYQTIDFIFHIGARTNTAEFNTQLLEELNTNYSKQIWDIATQYQIPLVYASSAATYGIGEYGYNDDHSIIEKLHPLNPYGVSKNEFDKWVLLQNKRPPFWAGLKFFNVYGPNEFHKGRMASVIFHSYHQILQTGKVNLFRSHHSDFEDGKQLRDFIYVQDVVDICHFLMIEQNFSGIYNVGTGEARTFLDLTNAVFNAMKKEPKIEFIDTPTDIREKYQYYTEAKMDKLYSIGYGEGFYSLEEGVEEYVKDYLQKQSYF